ncbi:MAG: redox-sensing transcriptional repressor Rex [Candidatus Omnitrophica bacterium]|jgi:redox-sensing transcriptional repressor|nr:redox-sensing transcriptional repressor Rex [Candidatus Omnitrophota bacterium]
MNKKKTPEGTISRLFAYLREVKKLSELGIKTISSSEIGDRLNLSDVQVRKDLGCFGSFGISGAGYDTGELSKSLEKILGKDKQWNICIVGIGRLGSALMMYSGFKKDGLYIAAAFDANPKKIGKVVESIEIESIDNLSKSIQEKKISIAIITTPSEQAQTVADSLVKAGIECIMNFAPVRLNVPDDIKVENVDLSHVLEILTYFASN